MKRPVIASTILRGVALLTVFIISSTTVFAADKSASGNKTKRPNILLIIGDDIGIDVTTDMYPGLIDGLLKQYGPQGHNHPDYRQIQGHPASTPTLNALAKEGMRFTQAWVQPFCSNTRSSILTGLYPAKTGVLDYTNWLNQSHHSFVRDLKEKGGYSTAIFGKWHMAGLNQLAPGMTKLYPGMKPKEAGFDLFLGNLNGGVETYWEYEYQIQDANTPDDQWRTETAPTRSVPGVAPTTFAPVVKVADTLNWIKEQKKTNPDKPWFVWLAFNLSHITGKQVPNPMAVPNIDTLDEPSRKEMQACGGNFGSANVGNCSDKALMRAMTNTLDTLVGKLLKSVDSIDKNTYVIYLGDNGTWMFGPKREFIDNMYITRQGRGKGTSSEAGARVEFAIRGPGIKANSVSDVPISGVDLFPTILKMAGLEPPKVVPNRDGSGVVDLDGESLAPILFNGAKQLRDPNMGYLLAETTNPVKKNLREAGARNTNYKLICDENADTANCTFYNLKNDPLEEYPLPKPESCANYQTGKWTPANQEWHFCRLQEVIGQKSFLAAKQ
jgi:arylsulfatase A-like enzyme